MKNSTKWNPRYEIYALAHGRTPDEMLAYDRERCPGGHMAEFMIWCSQRWAEWRKANGRRRDDPLWAEDHVSFDTWILEVACTPH